jgi:hypothetical protein
MGVATTRSQERDEESAAVRAHQGGVSAGVSEGTAEEIAARTVQKERARTGEARTSSPTSTRDISSGRRGGLRSGTARKKGRTYEQLYNEARAMNVHGRSKMNKANVHGRSKMNKAQLQRAVDGRKGRQG